MKPKPLPSIICIVAPSAEGKGYGEPLRASVAVSGTNGVVWLIGFFVGYVLWPFATIALQQATGSFTLAFLTIPIAMAAESLVYRPRARRQGAQRDRRLSASERPSGCPVAKGSSRAT